MLSGIRHTIKCDCILSQHMGLSNPPNFHFIVFSVLDGDEIRKKTVQCPNCGVLHRIQDIGKSKILSGKEDSKSLVSFEDIKSSMPMNLAKILEKYDLDISKWEMAQFIVDQQRWGEHIILSDEVTDSIRYVKYVRILGNDLYKVEVQEFEE